MFTRVFLFEWNNANSQLDITGLKTSLWSTSMPSGNSAWFLSFSNGYFATSLKEALPPCFWKCARETSIYNHLGPVYTKRQHQRCDNASDTVLIERMELFLMGLQSTLINSIAFNENNIASVIARVIAALMLTLAVDGPLVWDFIF